MRIQALDRHHLTIELNRKELGSIIVAMDHFVGNIHPKAVTKMRVYDAILGNLECLLYASDQFKEMIDRQEDLCRKIDALSQTTRSKRIRYRAPESTPKTQEKRNRENSTIIYEQQLDAIEAYLDTVGPVVETELNHQDDTPV